MKKFFILGALAIASMANEIQVFTSNTMHIALDSDSKIEKLFFGKTKEFYEKQSEIIKDLQKNSTSALATGAITTLQASSGEIAKNIAAGGSGFGISPALCGAVILRPGRGLKKYYPYFLK